MVPNKVPACNSCLPIDADPLIQILYTSFILKPAGIEEASEAVNSHAIQICLGAIVAVLHYLLVTDVQGICHGLQVIIISKGPRPGRARQQYQALTSASSL